MLVDLTLVKVAAELRRKAEQTEPAFSTRQIVEACFPGTLVTGGRLPDGIDEMVTRREAGNVIVYERTLGTPSQRFVIAHALAHLLFDDVRSAARRDRVGVPYVEARADEFAAELLAPLSEVEPYVGRWPSADPEEHELYLDMVDEIASHFAVPTHVIESRIRLLKPIRSCG